MKFIQPNTDLRVTLTGAQDGVDDSYFNAATANVKIETPSGTEVVADQTLVYISGSNGNYQVTIDKLLFASLVQGRIYVVYIRATDSTTGADREWKIVAKYDYDIDP